MDAATQGDYATAFDLYQKSANMGNDDAQLALGAMYLAGISTTQDPQKGLMWIQKAAVQENALAQFTLGAMYLEGTGVTQDNQEARKWLQRAADNGFAQAKTVLQQMDQ